MLKETVLRFRTDHLPLNNLPVEEATCEAWIEYPRVNSRTLLTRDIGIIRLIQVVSQESQQKALNNFKSLVDTELAQRIPDFIYQLNSPSTDTHYVAINEFAPDDSHVAVRTVGRDKNIYTGNIDILDQAESYYRKLGITDDEGHGYIAELQSQAKRIGDMLSAHMYTARMSAFSIVIRKTDDLQRPFQAELKIRDLSQVTRQAGKLTGYPIWGADCFWGMVRTVLWFRTR